MENEKVFLEWDGHEYEHKERRTDWFWALGIIAVAGSVTAFLLGNFLFGTFIVIAIVALFFVSITKPRHEVFKIVDDGIRIGETLYPFDSLKGFWIQGEGENSKLLLNSSRPISPVLVIPLGSEELVEQAQDLLSAVLQETQMREPISQALLERLGF
jgi:hypothetical protein